MRLTDFHTHVLPGMDDGAGNVEESLKMVDEALKQGVGRIIATPHFYPDAENPDSFLARRNIAEQELRDALKQSGREIELITGAEVGYYDSISSSRQLEKLCIGNTRLVLVEMPFRSWENAAVKNIIDMRDRLGVVPVLAHIDRYSRQRKRGMLESMLDAGVLVQANTEFFIKKPKKAGKMLKAGMVHFIGSDMHNTEKRPETIGKAAALIGEEGLSYIEYNCGRWF